MIVIKYEGERVPRMLELLLASTIRNSGCTVTDKVEVFQYDGTDLKSIPSIEEEHPVKHAIVYIGELFADHLVGEHRNITRFAVSLWNAVKHDVTGEIRNAVRILSEEDVMPFKELAIQYGMWDDEIDCIRSINNYNPGYVSRVAIR